MAISPNYHCAAEDSKGNITYAPIAILPQATMAGNFGKARLAMSTSVARARWRLLSGLGMSMCSSQKQEKVHAHLSGY